MGWVIIPPNILSSLWYPFVVVSGEKHYEGKGKVGCLDQQHTTITRPGYYSLFPRVISQRKSTPRHDTHARLGSNPDSSIRGLARETWREHKGFVNNIKILSTHMYSCSCVHSHPRRVQQYSHNTHVTRLCRQMEWGETVLGEKIRVQLDWSSKRLWSQSGISETELQAVPFQSPSVIKGVCVSLMIVMSWLVEGGKFLKKLWCCVGGHHKEFKSLRFER